jgi:Ca2+-binding RTX toxin-like protein
VKTPSASAEPVPEPNDPTPSPDKPAPQKAATKTGTDDGNRLTGTSGDDLIDARGGDDMIWGKDGSDVLSGGDGQDGFTFDSKPGSANIDTILDFNPEHDTIRLNDAVFAELERGKPSADNFVIGAAAKDSDDYVIYNSKTGALSYDPDGNGSAAAVQFGVIDNLIKLAASDFLVF